MRDGFLAIYHKLPSPARNAAATLRGMYLRRWRYNTESDQLRDETIERDSWSAAAWKENTEERIARLLHRAATRVPYYRDMWQRRRKAGDRSSIEVLENWPILEKDDLRSNARAFVADDCNPARMFHEQTSGTTGKPLDIWRSRRTVAQLYALVDARTLHWHGVSPNARWARLGGQLVIPMKQQRPPFWVWNAAMRQLYLSTYHLSPTLLPSYLDALKRYRIEYIAGYPSSVQALAHQALIDNRTDIKLQVCFTNAEPVTDEQRETIQAAFGCPVRETYGMAEMVAAASECEKGGLHQWPEIGHVEVWSNGRAAADGESGEFICTGLLNWDMPLIRYRVGDRGRRPETASTCECGRALPLFGEIDGRTTDMLITADGRQVFWLNPVFYGLPLRASQIIQNSLDQLTVLVSPAPGFGTQTTRTIEERLRGRMGDMQVDIQTVTEIPRSSNGKLSAVVCKLSPEEKQRALQVPPSAGTVSPRSSAGAGNSAGNQPQAG